MRQVCWELSRGGICSPPTLRTLAGLAGCSLVAIHKAQTVVCYQLLARTGYPWEREWGLLEGEDGQSLGAGV